MYDVLPQRDGGAVERGVKRASMAREEGSHALYEVVSRKGDVESGPITSFIQPLVTNSLSILNFCCVLYI